MSYDLISFDLDGTLVDTAAEIAEAANRALEAQGIPKRPTQEITELIGAGTRELILKLLARSAAEDANLPERVRKEDLLASMDHHYALATGTSAAPYPGCNEMLEVIKATGIRMACVTNKEFRHALRVLEVTRLNRYFDIVIGGDTLNEKKPHSSVLRHVAHALRADPGHSVHLGDSAIDVAAARNSGFTAWAVTYGYNAGMPITASDPDRLFSSLSEVAELVRSK